MPHPTVTISSGVLEGRALDTPAGTVDRYLGVPFGEMSAALRFQAPRPAPPWTGVRQASTFGPSPIQETAGPLLGLIPGIRLTDTSEDCLTLNVWSPAEPGEALPVLFWIYGGGFVVGGTAAPSYEASRLAAEQHVVVVSANYRLGLFGFADLRAAGGEAIGAATNCGLRDLLLALRWVRENIAQFGGDSDRVTAFGESAGAGCIVNLLAAPDARSLFRGAIAQSPGADLTPGPRASSFAAERLLEQVGVSSAAGLLQLSCEPLLQAQVTMSAPLVTSDSHTRELSPLVFHPYIDGDIVPDTPVRAAARGLGADIDLMIGTTTDEMRLFRDPSIDSMSPEELVDWTWAFLNQREALQTPTREFAQSVLADYRQLLASRPRNTPSDLLTQIQTDSLMRLPTYAIADERVGHGRTFAYEFAWASRNESTMLDACHAIDLPFTFDALDTDGWATFIGADEHAEPIGRALRSAWAAFAASGNPSCDALGVWPEWGTQRHAMVFDVHSRVTDDPMTDVRSIWDR